MSSLRLALKMSMDGVSHQGDDVATGKKVGSKEGVAKVDGINSSSNGNGPAALKRKRSESEVSLSSTVDMGSVKGDSDIEEGSSNPSSKAPAKKSKDNKSRSLSNLTDSVSSSSVAEERGGGGGQSTTSNPNPNPDSDSTLPEISVSKGKSDSSKGGAGNSNKDSTDGSIVRKASSKKLRDKQSGKSPTGGVSSDKMNATSSDSQDESSQVPRPTKSIKTASKMEQIPEKDELELDDVNVGGDASTSDGNTGSGAISGDVDLPIETDDADAMDIDGDNDEEDAKDGNKHTKKQRTTPSTTHITEGSDNLTTLSVEEIAPEGGSPRYQSHRAAAMVAKDRLAAKPTRTITATDGGPGDPSSSSYRPPEQRRSSGGGSNSSKSGPVEEAKWVQCEQCSKWRLLPQHVDLELLPEQWYCVMNEWDSLRNNCDAPEATAEATEGAADGAKDAATSSNIVQPSRSHSRGSGPSKSNQHRRNEDGNDNANKSHSSSSHRSGSSTAGKAVDPLNWVQCNKCAKWRKVPGSIDVDSLPDTWYCSLNTWAPYYSRCNAKEETDEPADGKADEDRSGSSHSKGGSHSAKKGSGGSASSSAGGSSAGGSSSVAVKKVTQWVQCERRNCKKWRKVPAQMDMAKFPEKWYCEMNTWDPERAGCDNAEETDSESEQQNGAPPSRSQLILANSKGPGALSYRRIIFGTDGRIRPCYNEKNKSGFGLFSFTESSRNCSSSSNNLEDRSNDYVEPSRRVAYWWSSAYDEKSGMRFKSINSSHPSANTPRGKDIKEEPVPEPEQAPPVVVPAAEVAKDAEAVGAPPVASVSPRPRDRDRGMSKELALLLGDEREREDRHSTPKKPRESKAKEREEEEIAAPIIEVPIAALEVEESSHLIDTIRRISNLSVESKLKKGIPKMRQKLWNRYSSMPFVDKLRIECNVVRCCLLSSPSCSLSLPVLVNTIQSMSFINYDEEMCRRCMSIDAVTSAIRRLELQGEVDTYMGTGSELIIVGFPPWSSQVDPMMQGMDSKWDSRAAVPLKMRKAFNAIAASRALIEEEEKAKKKKKGSSSSSSSSSVSSRNNRSSNNNNNPNNNSDNEDDAEEGVRVRGVDEGAGDGDGEAALCMDVESAIEDDAYPLIKRESPVDDNTYAG